MLINGIGIKQHLSILLCIYHFQDLIHRLVEFILQLIFIGNIKATKQSFHECPFYRIISIIFFQFADRKILISKQALLPFNNFYITLLCQVH